MPLDVAGTGTILLVGGGETARGEVWLENNTGGEVKIEQRDLTVTVSGVDQTGPHPAAADEVIADNSFRRLAIGVRDGAVHRTGRIRGARRSRHLDRDPDHSRVVGRPGERAGRRPLPSSRCSPRWSRPTTITTAVIVRNVGNVAVTIDAGRRRTAVRSRRGPTAARRRRGRCRPGATGVQPRRDRAHALRSRWPRHRRSRPPGGRRSGSTSRFRSALGTGGHVRALPRIVNDRFSIDLVT